MMANRVAALASRRVEAKRANGIYSSPFVLEPTKLIKTWVRKVARQYSYVRDYLIAQAEALLNHWYATEPEKVPESCEKPACRIFHCRPWFPDRGISWDAAMQRDPPENRDCVETT
jgi:hypothetical protein